MDNSISCYSSATVTVYIWQKTRGKFVWISAAARSVLQSFRFDDLNPPWTYCLQHSWQLMWHWGQDWWMSHQHEVGVTQQTLTPQDSVSCIHPICFLYHTHTLTQECVTLYSEMWACGYSRVCVMMWCTWLEEWKHSFGVHKKQSPALIASVWQTESISERASP